MCKIITYHDILIRQLEDNDEKPYYLLLLADPTKPIIDEYIKQSEIFIATVNDEILGVILYPLAKESVKIKNLALKAVYQGRGIGKMMI